MAVRGAYFAGQQNAASAYFWLRPDKSTVKLCRRITLIVMPVGEERVRLKEFKKDRKFYSWLELARMNRTQFKPRNFSLRKLEADLGGHSAGLRNAHPTPCLLLPPRCRYSVLSAN